jgi:CBS domain-containing protein
MKVTEVMTSTPVGCAPATTLALAAQLMFEGDCGVLPVVSDDRLVGVVTDRDLFIALGTSNRMASQLTVGEVMVPRVWTCGPDDDVRAALALMKEHKVRRLPVVGPANSLVGIVTINDLLLEAGPKGAVRSDAVIDALQGICAHQQPLVRTGN